MVLAEEFSHDIFRKSLARLFERDGEGHLKMAFNATLEVFVNKVGLRSACALQCHVSVVA